MTTSTDTPNLDRGPRTFSSTTRVFGDSTGDKHVVATSHEDNYDRLIVVVGAFGRAASVAQDGGVGVRQPSEPIASAGLTRSQVEQLCAELHAFLFATRGGEAPAAAVVEQVPTAEIEELASDLTPEQDARVSALHQAAAVSGRLIEALGSGHITFETEDVLAFARWVISGDAAVEPVAIATAELAADQ